MKNLNLSSVLVSTLIIFLTLTSFGVEETELNESRWPFVVNSDEGVLTVYQPQLDSLEDNTISARSAVSVKLSGESEPIFGAIWLTSRISTDRETRMAILKDLVVKRIKFPDDYNDKLKDLTSIIEEGIPDKELEISLDKINAMLDIVKKEKEVSKDFIMKAPEIIFSTNAAFLVSIDGEPKLKPVEGKKMMKVINSSYTILLDTETKKYYLGSGENWVSTTDIMDDWTPTTKIPEDIKNFDSGKENTEEEEEEITNSSIMPRVIVSTKSAELIVIDGEPEFSPIRGTDLLYVENTKSDIFMEIGSQRIYLLLSGRWFTSEKKKGPWKFVASDKLPADFAKIPPGSAKGEVLTQISGTEEARDAVLDSYIPQTAAINRDETNLVVAFDGEPEFEKIEGTDMEYAVNSQEQIIQVDDKYYCCKGGVWYVTDKLLTTVGNTTEAVAETAGGVVAGVLKTAENITKAALNLTLGTVWAVCGVVPPVIYTIPPSCPVYPVTYCKVYEETPEVIYVGYTPGYVGSYRYGGCMVYGTGYRYTPWCGSYYWPRPCTFGLGVTYGGLGWRVGVGFGYGAFYGGIAVARTAGAIAWHRNGGYGRYGRYGRGGNNNIYVNNSRTFKKESNRNNNGKGNRPGNKPGDRRPGNKPGDRRPSNKPGDRRPSDKPGDRRPSDKVGDRRPSDKAGDRRPSDRKSRDRQPENKLGDRAGSRESTQRDRTTRESNLRKNNNVFADKNGNVSRKNLDGWQTKGKNGWNNSKQSPQTRKSLDSQHRARERGASNTRRSQQSRSSSRPSYSGSRNRSSSSQSRSRSSSRSSGGRNRSGGGGGGRRGGGGGRRR